VDAIPWLSDGGVHTLELLYHGGQRRLWGFLGLPENPAEANGEEMALFDVRIPDGGRGQWYVGVTGSCGGLWQKVRDMSPTFQELTRG
jgi:peptide-N4-(N-acetyl-beta-glucosaminyl)asparagine amidase